jgi:hypothetical protein
LYSTTTAIGLVCTWIGSILMFIGQNNGSLDHSRTHHVSLSLVFRFQCNSVVRCFTRLIKNRLTQYSFAQEPFLPLFRERQLPAGLLYGWSIPVFVPRRSATIREHATASSAISMGCRAWPAEWAHYERASPSLAVVDIAVLNLAQARVWVQQKGRTAPLRAASE